MEGWTSQGSHQATKSVQFSSLDPDWTKREQPSYEVCNPSADSLEQAKVRILVLKIVQLTYYGTGVDGVSTTES